ncbi:7606_t:CDS:2 [Funneliformis geosporum]|nr:7606_t:CDS:2 [Funneliformis geosporum]
MSKDLSNQNYSLKGFENWLNAVEGRDKGLDSWDKKQKIEDEKELTREELKKELEKLIEIKEKELQKLKEQLKMIRYNCNGCQKIIPASEVKRYCLDDNRGIKMGCILCPTCDYTQFSTKNMTGLFPLLAGIEKPITGLKVIKTPEFKRHEEAEIKSQQEQLKSQQPSSLFNCDKCSKPIACGKEKEHYFARYKPNTSVVSDVKWRILCPPCESEKPLNKELAPNTTFNQANLLNDERTPTFIRYQEYKENLKDQVNPLAKRERQVEVERQAMLKKEQEK